MAKIFFYSGFHNLEEQEMAQVTDFYGYDAVDISEWLAHSTDDQLDQSMERHILDTHGCYSDCYFFPGVPLDRLTGKPYMAHATVLRDDDAGIDGLSALDKICALLDHPPTPYEQQVSAYAVGGIAGLQLMGATDVEIRQITLRDRLIRGSTIAREDAIAAQFHKVERLPNTGVHQIFEIVTPRPIGDDWDKPAQAATVDRILLRTISRYPISILFKQVNEDNCIVSLTAYSNRTWCLHAAEKLAERHTYCARKPQDKRSKLGVIVIAREPSTTLAADSDFNACFLNPAGNSGPTEA